MYIQASRDDFAYALSNINMQIDLFSQRAKGFGAESFSIQHNLESLPVQHPFELIDRNMNAMKMIYDQMTIIMFRSYPTIAREAMQQLNAMAGVMRELQMMPEFNMLYGDNLINAIDQARNVLYRDFPGLRNQ